MQARQEMVVNEMLITMQGKMHLKSTDQIKQQFYFFFNFSNISDWLFMKWAERLGKRLQSTLKIKQNQEKHNSGIDLKRQKVKIYK